MKQHMKQDQILNTIGKFIRQGRRNELAPLLFDPSAIEKSERIPDGDQIKIEARIISDALESVTNGMYNPEAVTELLSIGDASPLASWKALCLSISAFYNGNRDEALSQLSHIDDESPASALIPVITQLCEKKEGREGALSPKSKSLFHQVTEDRSFITSAQNQLKEYLEGEMEELFVETAILLIRDLKGDYPKAARSLAMWITKTASAYGFSPEIIVSNLKLIFGPAEGSRLCALALQDEEPEISLLFWIRTLISRLKQRDIEEAETAAFREIIAEAAMRVEKMMCSPKEAEKAGYEIEEWKTYMQSLASLSAASASLLTIFDPAITFPTNREEDSSAVFSFLTGLGYEEECRPMMKRHPQERPSIPQRERHPARPVQLELFA
jgi:hypothetical protein